jgi:NitT/TauT family transport system substrate-binding protein
MRLRIAENFRAVFYAPFYAIRELGFPEREGLEIEWLTGERPGGAVEDVKSGRIDAMWGGPMRVLMDHDTGGATLRCFGEVAGRDPFYVIGKKRPSFALKDLATMRLGVVSEVPTPWWCLRADLEDAGINTASLSLTTNLSMEEQLGSLAAGRLDAVQVFEPYASRALAAGNAVLYAQSSRGPTCYTTFLCTRDGATKKRAEFAALTRATQSTLDWVDKNGGAELARVTASFFPDVPSELLSTALERYHAAGFWSRNTKVQKAGFERLAYSMKLCGALKRVGTYAECATSFD